MAVRRDKKHTTASTNKKRPPTGVDRWVSIAGPGHAACTSVYRQQSPRPRGLCRRSTTMHAELPRPRVYTRCSLLSAGAGCSACHGRACVRNIRVDGMKTATMEASTTALLKLLGLLRQRQRDAPAACSGTGHDQKRRVGTLKRVLAISTILHA